VPGPASRHDRGLSPAPALERSELAELAFFYGTLMTGFDRRRRAGIESKLRYVDRGWIQAALFDLGIYPAAVPTPDGRVWGEIYEIDEPASVLNALDEIEGYSPGDPDRSLYTRALVPATLERGDVVDVWVYFYNAPLGQAPQIASGDYLKHVRAR
jgi:gamma-glutamylcyclotransferase (GGCT)/AIG2-like uncharacterized protein YtfP